MAGSDIQETIEKRIQRCAYTSNGSIGSFQLNNIFALSLFCSANVPFHSAHCLIPVPAVHILANNKQLLSSVVHAFCDREKKEMKVGVA